MCGEERDQTATRAQEPNPLQPVLQGAPMLAARVWHDRENPTKCPSVSVDSLDGRKALDRQTLDAKSTLPVPEPECP